MTHTIFGTILVLAWIIVTLGAIGGGGIAAFITSILCIIACLVALSADDARMMAKHVLAERFANAGAVILVLAFVVAVIGVIFERSLSCLLFTICSLIGVWLGAIEKNVGR